ncbi:Ser/Thr protein phosphatase, putative [Trichomonas vaginalis G3]|uniref:Serine/threonine-protein phosphatase n=1 Tax=Trichomonas vaginalis (strain ATCC PRA-98 / G3) TaxID=412133 RepID=A2EEM1_TRIV3|nr:phosphoprotein phosphatase protein [Trichomonas vaginalis G3]EAY08928.1 Ser/Thr protein phosphatase, putative [Trichomonas vaginalis G3]KAI5494394.1 phosphoprotein phosphatase protein [Trichomonas vaginalis G3]|eukprot:XP_001321151.1 Ser/Thr protein phosphatase [Trichomonas vaginalis G3]
MLPRSIIDAYTPLIHDDILLQQIQTGSLEIPKLKQADLINLISQVTEIFKMEQTLMYLEGDYTIVGDLHGNLRDLLRILAYAGNPLSSGYIFLGDYVDRGEFSIEIITLLFSFKLAYPTKVFLLRGNHEFASLNKDYGFKKQCSKEYGDYVYDCFNEAFAYLPLAAILNKHFFLVHGGLAPKLEKVEQISQMKRPIFSMDLEGNEGNVLTGMMWSDPSEEISYFSDNIRGVGFYYGDQAVQDFLGRNNLKVIIRAHECVDGLRQKFNGNVITVFSSSCYNSILLNTSGILQITNSNKINSYIFNAVEQWHKKEMKWKSIEVDITIPLCQRVIKPRSTTSRPRCRKISCLVKNYKPFII